MNRPAPKKLAIQEALKKGMTLPDIVEQGIASKAFVIKVRSDMAKAGPTKGTGKSQAMSDRIRRKLAFIKAIRKGMTAEKAMKLGHSSSAYYYWLKKIRAGDVDEAKVAGKVVKTRKTRKTAVTKKLATDGITMVMAVAYGDDGREYHVGSSLEHFAEVFERTMDKINRKD